MIVGVLATLVSLYYYLAVVRAMYMRPSAELQVARGGRRLAGARADAARRGRDCLVVSVGSLFAVGPLIDLAKHAAARCRSESPLQRSCKASPYRR